MNNTSTVHLPEFAFYYPGHIWGSGEWIKNLILFFDGIALLVPEYKRFEPELLDPYIATPLADRGLLRILSADSVVDEDATRRLAEAITHFISSGALDKLAGEKTAFHELSRSRLGYYGDQKLSEAILKELKKRGLARDTEDGLSIPMHPKVRVLVLTLLSQILRAQGNNIGLDLSPATDRPQLVHALNELLSIPGSPSTAAVVAFDLEAVGVDLSGVPMDEVLSFKAEHRDKHQAYARTVRKFVRELSPLSATERAAAFEDRQAEIKAMAKELRRISRKAWKKPAGFALSVAGAASALIAGHPIGAIISAASAVIKSKEKKPDPTGPYSYLFSTPS